MKKYLQITIVLAVFFVIVFFRRHNSTSGNSLNNDLSSTGGLSQNNSFQSSGGQSSGGVSSGSGTGNSSTVQSGNYKNGTYDGSVEDAYYGNVQVRVTVSNGRISNIAFLQYPSDNNTSYRINSQALPILRSEAIKAQSAQVDSVSGASYSSQAFVNSLDSALQKAG